MKYLLFVLGFIQIAKYAQGNVVNRQHWELNAAIQKGNKDEYYQSLGNQLSNLMNKRCLNMFDDGCDNGGLPGSGRDEEWITGPGSTPGKRCINIGGEECSSGGLPGDDEQWIGSGNVPGKRCLNIFDEGCDNGGLPGSGEDEEWIKDPGNTPGKRCLNVGGEACDNGGLPGAGEDEENLKTQKPIPEDGCHKLFDDCARTNDGLSSSGRQWIKYLGHKPGKQNAHLNEIRKFLQNNQPAFRKRNI